MLLKNHAQFNGYEARNAKLHVLGSDPSLGGSDGGRVWWRSDTGQFRGWDGAAAHTLTNLIEQVQGDGTIGASLANKIVSLSIPAASAAVRGTMSAADKTKLDAATNANTPSTLVFRDASGNFVAGTITAALNGLAADATLHGGQTLAQVRDFAQTTGQRAALSAISDFNAAVRLNTLDQLTPPATTVSMNSQRLSNLADPTQAQDAATKNYVDSVATGLDPKGSARFGTTGALAANYANGSSGVGATLTASANGAFPTTDNVTPALNDRVLVKNQAAQPQNGLYRITDLGSGATPWVLTRTTDADSAAEITPGMFTFIEEGTLLGKTGWVLGSTGATTVGTTALPFTQFSGAGTYLAGNGLSLTGSTFAAVGTAGRISVGATIDIDAAYVGQASITTLGTIATGVWNATTIAVAKGGTGATSVAGAKTNLGFMSRYAADLGAGTTLTVPHNLGTVDVTVAIWDKTTGDLVLVDPKIVDTNNISVTFGDPIAAGSHRVVVMG
jgi:hypothetical protein